MRRLPVLAVLAPLLALAPLRAAADRAPAAPPRLAIVSFNVLAPLWVEPDLYPPEVEQTAFDAGARRTSAARVLGSLARIADVVCLQEVLESEYLTYARALGPAFEGRFASHEHAHWEDGLAGQPWQPNGNAVFVRRRAVTGVEFEAIPLGTGNRAVAVAGTHAATGRRLRVYSVQVDPDFQRTRDREIGALLAQAPADPRTTDVVCGDINEDVETGPSSQALRRAGFVDVLAAAGTRRPTHPFASANYAAAHWAATDHVLVRHAAPLRGEVHDFGLWAIPDEVERVTAALETGGSDRFPVRAVVGW